MARVEERRLWVRLMSKDALRNYMEFRGFRSASELAERAGCSKATIGFLVSKGKASRTSCSPKMARKIEDALQAPPGSLFAAEVTVVTRYIARDAA